MTLLLNPWAWIAVIAYSAVLIVISYMYGGKDAKDAARAAHATALEQTIQQARENAVIDMQAAVEAEAKRQQTRVEFKDRIVTVEKVIHEKPLPATCAISDDGVRLFNDAIDAANTATGSKPKPMPTPPKPAERPHGNVSARLPWDY